MLRFLRKYQLILLAIGGSLLMVVFLIGPIFRRLGPALANRTIATVEGGATKFSVMDRQQATAEIEVISRVFPFMFGRPDKGTRGLINLDDQTDHWMLLSYEAEKAGLVGEAGDGQRWLQEELSAVYAYTEKQYELYKQIPYMPFVNQQLSKPEVQQEIEQRAVELRNDFPARVHKVALSQRVPDEVVYKMLSKARGVLRMIQRHDRSIRESDRDVIAAVREVFDSAVANYVYIPASTQVDESYEPNDEQLQAQFNRFKDSRPGEGDLGFGYTLPPRVKIGWMTLSHDAIAGMITPDRIEIRKRWSENREKYPGEFEAEREKVQNEIVNEQVNDLLIDADRIIVGQLRTALRGVPQDGQYYELPEGWSGVTLEGLAQTVVREMKDQRGVDFPMPSVTTRTDQWFAQNDIQQLPALGGAYWQVGPERIPVSTAPTLARDMGGSAKIAVQKELPILPAAQDSQGDRLYIVLYDTRPESAPDSWTEIRDTLARDYREVRAYESLTDRLEELSQTAKQDGGIEAVASAFATPESDTDDPTQPPIGGVQTSHWAVITRHTIGRLDPAKTVDARANVDTFRDAVLDKASTLDPMAEFGSFAPDASVVAVAIPSRHAVAVARILAYRPATKENRYSLQRRDVATLSARDYSEVNKDDFEYPFTLDALKKRLGFKVRGNDDSDEGI